jgi:LPS export ABC transporter protein LptC
MRSISGGASLKSSIKICYNRFQELGSKSRLYSETLSFLSTLPQIPSTRSRFVILCAKFAEEVESEKNKHPSSHSETSITLKLLTFSAILCLTASACTFFEQHHATQAKIEKKREDFNDRPEYRTQDFSAYQIKNGTPALHIQAKQMEYTKAKKQIQLMSVTLTLFDKQNAHLPSATIQSERASVDVDSQLIIAQKNVQTRFQDGFTFKSQELHYDPQNHWMKVPENLAVKGYGLIHDSQDDSTQRTTTDKKDPSRLNFASLGMLFDLSSQTIHLSQNVFVNFTHHDPTSPTPQNTKIRSDHCKIDRKTSEADFLMNSNRPLSEQFVYIEQTDLTAKARKCKVNYHTDHLPSSSPIKVIQAYEDVRIEELSDQTLTRYSTCGLALFNPEKKQIWLEQFPQVYQDNDTITGERIIIFQDTQVVEIEQPNGLSQGKSL